MEPQWSVKYHSARGRVCPPQFWGVGAMPLKILQANLYILVLFDHFTFIYLTFRQNFGGYLRLFFVGGHHTPPAPWINAWCVVWTVCWSFAFHTLYLRQICHFWLLTMAAFTLTWRSANYSYNWSSFSVTRTNTNTCNSVAIKNWWKLWNTLNVLQTFTLLSPVILYMAFDVKILVFTITHTWVPGLVLMSVWM